MIESVTININGIETVVEIPFGFIPLTENGPLKYGDKVYMITTGIFDECSVNDIEYFEVRDFYLVIRPTQQ
jgi:hypothetical protein